MTTVTVVLSLFLVSSISFFLFSFFFFFNDTATTEIYTLSLHDALPICRERDHDGTSLQRPPPGRCIPLRQRWQRDRKSTRLNSSHTVISYAVFCLKKKKKKKKNLTIKPKLYE